MLTHVVQRWSAGVARYRPAGETIDTRRYDVAAIADDRTARDYVMRHHYSHSYPAARRRYGLYCGGELVGVAVYSVPANAAALRDLPGAPDERVELGRFLLADAVPANGESWFLARTFELLHGDGFAGVLSFSDPLPRYDQNGAVVFRGHVGTCYQASNAIYTGLGTARTLRVLPDGTVLSDRAIQKIRAGERGWRPAAAQLVAAGAAPLALDEDRRAWLREWLPRVTGSLRHPGNHRYLWALHARDRRHLPPSLTYPKFAAPASALPAARFGCRKMSAKAATIQADNA